MRIVKLFYLTAAFIVSFSWTLLAQTASAGNWLMYLGSNQLSDKLSIHSDRIWLQLSERINWTSKI